jgi:hypothetical protein
VLGGNFSWDFFAGKSRGKSRVELWVKCLL